MDQGLSKSTCVSIYDKQIFLKTFMVNGCKKVWKMKKIAHRIKQGKFHEISGWSNMTSHKKIVAPNMKYNFQIKALKVRPKRKTLF